MSTTERMPELLEAYFADLERALAGADPRERAETLQAMREHAAEMLTRDGRSDQTAERVIADFGPVEQVAAAASTAPPSAPAGTAGPRSWTDIWLLAGSIASLVFYVFPLLAVVVLICAILRLRRSAGNRVLQKTALWISVVAVVLSVTIMFLHSGI